MAKSCKDCTKCCEGWLQADIRGHEMGPTNHPYKPIPCIFVEQDVGCKEYKKRPKNPCKSFECQWIIQDEFPEELKPSLVNALPISSYTKNRKILYLTLIEAGEKMDPDALSWYITWAMSKQVNFAWKVNGKLRWMGHQDFQEDMTDEFMNHRH